MKIIYYYISLLALIIVIAFTMANGSADVDTSMSMEKMVGVSALLVIYVIAMAFVGEGPTEDERAHHHRYLANRFALIIGTVIIAAGILYQLFFSHQFDYWLLIALGGINVTKIISLIFLNYKR